MSFLEDALRHSASLEEWTLCTVDDVPDEQFTDQPGGLTNHPAWVLGHLTYAVDNLTRLLGGDVARDDAWYEPFRGGSEPTADRADYPARAVLIDAYRDASRRLRQTVHDIDADVLDRPVEDERIAGFFPTLGRWTAHVLLTEGAFHTGQLSAWRCAKGMPPVFGIEANLQRLVTAATVR